MVTSVEVSEGDVCVTESLQVTMGGGVVKDGMAGSSLRMVDSVARNMATSSLITSGLNASYWKTPTSFVKATRASFHKAFVATYGKRSLRQLCIYNDGA